VSGPEDSIGEIDFASEIVVEPDPGCAEYLLH
jgi:hypothetical protein